MSEPEADELHRQQAGLRCRLNRWDPIGVADVVDDEYDCLLAPLRQQFSGHPSRTGISAYLRRELSDHFGLVPARCAVEEIADQLVAWAASWNLHT